MPAVQASAFGDGDITKGISTVNLHVIRCTYEVRPRPSRELYVLGADAKIRKFGSPVDASLGPIRLIRNGVLELFLAGLFL